MNTFRVVFACTGNTCRSPMAEALARAGANRRRLGAVEFRSAGVFAVDGAPASDAAIRVGARHGLDLTAHRSSSLDTSGVAREDLVLGMTAAHVSAVRGAYGDVRVALVTEALPPGDPRRGEPVPDPFGGPDAAYEETWKVLHDCVEALLDSMSRGGPAVDGAPAAGSAGSGPAEEAGEGAS